jgi:hypothetical protein
MYPPVPNTATFFLLYGTAAHPFGLDDMDSDRCAEGKPNASASREQNPIENIANSCIKWTILLGCVCDLYLVFYVSNSFCDAEDTGKKMNRKRVAKKK